MAILVLGQKFLIKEIPIYYRDRPEGSVSKLDTIIKQHREIYELLLNRYFQFEKMDNSKQE